MHSEDYMSSIFLKYYNANEQQNMRSGYVASEAPVDPRISKNRNAAQQTQNSSRKPYFEVY